MNTLVSLRLHSSFLIHISQKWQRSALVTNKTLKSHLLKTAKVYFSLMGRGDLLGISPPPRPRLIGYAGTFSIAMAERVLGGCASATECSAHSSWVERVVQLILMTQPEWKQDSWCLYQGFHCCLLTITLSQTNPIAHFYPSFQIHNKWCCGIA